MNNVPNLRSWTQIDLPQFNFSKGSLGIQKNLSFEQFVNLVNPHYEWYGYLEQIATLLQDIADDKLYRLMIFMPPRHGKSELVSRLFSAYYLYKHPNRWVALTSYGAELAHTFSRNARDNFTRLGGRLKSDAANVKNWETGRGGGVWASGVGGPASGKGFNLGIIDDPIKDALEAGSSTLQHRNNDWFNSVFWTRREPLNAVIVIQTRWGKNDLSGYILSKEDDEPEWWHIAHFEAIKEKKPEYPKTCIVEPDNRKDGDALASWRYPIDKLRKIKKRIGIFFWNCLYQQNPQLRTGRVYHAFDGKNIGPASYEINLDNAEGYYHSHDFGAVNHVWGLWVKLGKQYLLVHSEKLSEGTTTDRANDIEEHFEDRDIVAGWGGAKSEEQQRIDYTDAGVEIRELDVTDVESQIDKANKMLGDETMIICSDQLHAIDQLENCIRDDNEGIADKSKWHFCDMIRYFATGVGDDEVIVRYARQ